MGKRDPDRSRGVQTRKQVKSFVVQPKKRCEKFYRNEQLRKTIERSRWSTEQKERNRFQSKVRMHRKRASDETLVLKDRKAYAARVNTLSGIPTEEHNKIKSAQRREQRAYKKQKLEDSIAIQSYDDFLKEQGAKDAEDFESVEVPFPAAQSTSSVQMIELPSRAGQSTSTIKRNSLKVRKVLKKASPAEAATILKHAFRRFAEPVNNETRAISEAVSLFLTPARGKGKFQNDLLKKILDQTKSSNVPKKAVAKQPESVQTPRR